MATEPEITERNPRRRLQMWFELFRDLALISLALAGGVITLLGTVFIDATRKPSAFIAVVLFSIAAVACLIGQSHVVDLNDKNQGPDVQVRRMRVIALVLLGAGAGSFVTFALRALGLYGSTT